MNSEQQAKSIIEAISREAKARWGDDWIAELVRAYCEIESAEVGELIKPQKRRSQIERSMKTHSATLPTLIRLTKAVGIEIELTITEKRKL